MSNDQKRYLNRNEASCYLLERWGLSRTKATLAKLASEGGGPFYYKATREALYAPSDLDDWATKLIGPAAFSAAEHRKDTA